MEVLDEDNPLKDLIPVAKELNAASDLLSLTVNELDKEFRKINIGIPAFHNLLGYCKNRESGK